MNALNSNQLQIQKLARDFAERELHSTSATSAVLDGIDGALLEKVRALGLINVRIPEEYGGLGMKTLDACVIAEEFGAGNGHLNAVLEASELASSLFLYLASPEQKSNLLSALTSSAGFLALDLGCPNRPEALTLQAVSLDEGYVINGRCDAVVNAHIADFIIAFTRSDTEKTSTDWAAFVVPIGTTTKLPGIKILDRHNLMGKGSLDIASLEFDNVKIAKGDRLRFNQNLKALWQGVSYRNFPIIASGCIGVARSAMLAAIAYAKERITFGQTIAQHQAVSFILADMAKDIEAARQLTWQAAVAADLGKEDLILSASCKSFAQEVVMRVTTEAVQVLGAYGYCREYPTERLMRNAALYQLIYGSSRQLKGEIGKKLLA